MDANKLKVLKDINYTVRKTCGNCQHFGYNDNYALMKFGTCQIQTYDHMKHSDSKRQLSVNEYGYCKKHEWYSNFENIIHGFAELMEK